MKPHAKTDVRGLGKEEIACVLCFYGLFWRPPYYLNAWNSRLRKNMVQTLFLLEFLQPLLFFLIFLMSMQCLFSIMSKADVQ